MPQVDVFYDQQRTSVVIDGTKRFEDTPLVAIAEGRDGAWAVLAVGREAGELHATEDRKRNLRREKLRLVPYQESRFRIDGHARKAKRTRGPTEEREFVVFNPFDPKTIHGPSMAAWIRYGVAVADGVPKWWVHFLELTPVVLQISILGMPSVASSQSDELLDTLRHEFGTRRIAVNGRRVPPRTAAELLSKEGLGVLIQFAATAAAITLVAWRNPLAFSTTGGLVLCGLLIALALGSLVYWSIV